MYPLLRAVLFLFDPEKVHHFSMNCLQALCRVGFIRNRITRMSTVKSEPVKLLSLTFPNRVGLAAGFDKNAEYLKSLSALGFGFVEIGTVTPVAQSGNEKPRLFRLPKDRALINRMGFNNRGVQAAKKNIEAYRKSFGHSKMIIGGNIGKNKVTPNAEAWKDYETCFLALYDVVDYFVVNVSSPNTPGLRDLQSIPALEKILVNLINHRSSFSIQKPLLLKLAPDMEVTELDEIIQLALHIKLDGLILTNTTTSRSHLTTSETTLHKIGAGGLSGRPLKQKAQEMLQHAATSAKGKLLLIGSGGIFDAQDAAARLDAGASLVQVYTGFIYEGPFIVKKILNF